MKANLTPVLEMTISLTDDQEGIVTCMFSVVSYLPWLPWKKLKLSDKDWWKILTISNTAYSNLLFIHVFSAILLSSPAGSMLYHILHALVLLPIQRIHPLLHELMSLLSKLDTLCKLLPQIQALEVAELEGIEGRDSLWKFDNIYNC